MPYLVTEIQFLQFHKILPSAKHNFLRFFRTLYRNNFDTFSQCKEKIMVSLFMSQNYILIYNVIYITCHSENWCSQLHITVRNNFVCPVKENYKKNIYGQILTFIGAKRHQIFNCNDFLKIHSTLWDLKCILFIPAILSCLSISFHFHK